MFEVYVHTSPSGKRYVGYSARGWRRRWVCHKSDARKGSNLPFHRALRKYGPDSFTSIVLERMTTEAGAHRAECMWIKELGAFGSGGYNLTAGGEGISGFSMSAESVEKSASAQRGRKHSDETRAQMSATRRGRKQSAESVAKSAAARRGKKRSEETRAKLRAAWVLRKAKP